MPTTTHATNVAEGATMEPRIIKTEEQYRRYIDEVARLAAIDPDAESDEGNSQWCVWCGHGLFLAIRTADVEAARFLAGLAGLHTSRSGH